MEECEQTCIICQESFSSDDLVACASGCTGHLCHGHDRNDGAAREQERPINYCREPTSEGSLIVPEHVPAMVIPAPKKTDDKDVVKVLTDQDARKILVSKF